MKNLSVLADEILESVVTVKEAASVPTTRTEVGGLLTKLADELRAASEVKVTYADLARFRKTYGI